jgi:hypothetical protein
MTSSDTGYHFGVPNLEVISDLEIRNHFQRLLDTLEPQGFTLEIESWTSPVDELTLADCVWRPQVLIHRYWYIGFCVRNFFYSFV